MDTIKHINDEIEIIDRKHQAIEKICKRIEDDPDMGKDMKMTIDIVRSMNEDMEAKKEILLEKLTKFKEKVKDSTGMDPDEIDLS